MEGQRTQNQDGWLGSPNATSVLLRPPNHKLKLDFANGWYLAFLKQHSYFFLPEVFRTFIRRPQVFVTSLGKIDIDAELEIVFSNINKNITDVGSCG